MEQTINHHAKTQGGIIGMGRNYSAHYRWCTTRHVRASYYQATMAITDIVSQGNTSHKELKSSQISQTDKEACKIVQAISNFLNTFQVDNKDVLYCISPGAPAPVNTGEDLLQADKIGKEAHITFVKERFIDKTRSFHSPIANQNLKTFSTIKVKLGYREVKEVKTSHSRKECVWAADCFGLGA